jgi:hypothetical protein
MDSSFLQYIGGPSSCFALVKVLMPLACVTETAVRSRAVKSLATVIADIPGATTASGGTSAGFGTSEEWSALKAFIVTLTGLAGIVQQLQ